MQKLTQQLALHQLTVATAESCTGGLLAKQLTDLPGSSRWFEAGWVTYSNTAKQQLLQVSAHTLQTHGAVSQATAQAMAQGALTHSHANIAIATTGIAGPSGTTSDKPVGTVWIAFLYKKQLYTECLHLSGSREQIRETTVSTCFLRLLQWLPECGF